MNAQIDIYCERLGVGLWAEPLNLVSNFAFIIAAIWLWPMTRHDPGARLLAALIFIIGVGSGLFHSFATQWASLADVIPIALFILVALYIMTGRLLRWPGPNGLTALILFIPYTYFMMRFLRDTFGDLNGSVPYVAVMILIFAYALIAAFRYRNIALGLGAVGVIFAVSITFRSVDQAICEALPQGVHYLWHILNACLLSGMVITLSRTPRWRAPSVYYEPEPLRP